MCILLSMWGQNDKVHFKNFKLSRIIPKKKTFNFFPKIWGGGGPSTADHLPLLVFGDCSNHIIFQYAIR